MAAEIYISNSSTSQTGQMETADRVVRIKEERSVFVDDPGHVTERKHLFKPASELLAVSFCQYLHRIRLCYLTTLHVISSVVARLLTKHPNAFQPLLSLLHFKLSYSLSADFSLWLINYLSSITEYCENTIYH